MDEFTADGRALLADLYKQYEKVISESGWHRDVIFEATEEGVQLPITAFYTPQAGPALWVLAGVHGEEPAGPNAIARQIPFLQALGEQIPIVLMPMLNPMGYRRDWRYPNEYRDFRVGKSVSDTDHLVATVEDPTVPRIPKPSSVIADRVTSYALELTKTYPPLLVVDHHEDEITHKDELKPYIYSSGQSGVHEKVAEVVVQILLKAGMDLELSGITRYGEPIINGVVSNPYDGSIDELLSSTTILVNKQPAPGPAAPACVVVETPITNIPLEKRVRAHENVIQALPELWQLVQ